MSQKQAAKERPPPPRFVRCRFCELTATQTAGRYDVHGDCIGSGQISDYEHPATGDPLLDGLVVSAGGLLWGITNLVIAVMDGDFVVAAMADLNTRWWALSATQWAQRFGKTEEPCP